MGDVIPFRPLRLVDELGLAVTPELEAAVAALPMPAEQAELAAAGASYDAPADPMPTDRHPLAALVDVLGVPHIRVVYELEGAWWVRFLSLDGVPVGAPFETGANDGS